MAQVTKRSKEEMVKVWEEFHRTRDQKVKNILSEEYLPIVRYVAEKMIERLPHNVQVEDLVSAGVFGLFDAVERFDPESLQERIERTHEHACGGGPMVAVMKAARALGAEQATVLRYADSGDEAERNKSRVVGYLSAVLTAPPSA